MRDHTTYNKLFGPSLHVVFKIILTFSVGMELMTTRAVFWTTVDLEVKLLFHCELRTTDRDDVNDLELDFLDRKKRKKEQRVPKLISKQAANLSKFAA